VTIMPSRWEGFGFVAIESMAQGTPVLASEAGALPEVIGKYGLVKDLSTPDKIAKELEKLNMADILDWFKPRELQSFVLREYSKKRFCEDIKELYREVSQ
uniref:glycosyltransferase n=1 Tax=Staphylococcus aureus TaxID=1280 RepID=UPI00301E29F9